MNELLFDYTIDTFSKASLELCNKLKIDLLHFFYWDKVTKR